MKQKHLMVVVAALFVLALATAGCVFPLRDQLNDPTPKEIEEITDPALLAFFQSKVMWSTSEICEYCDITEGRTFIIIKKQNAGGLSWQSFVKNHNWDIYFTVDEVENENLFRVFELTVKMHPDGVLSVYLNGEPMPMSSYVEGELILT